MNLLLLVALLTAPALAQEGDDLDVEVVTATVAPRPVAPTVLFIHGMHLQRSTWKPWQEWFEERGYETLAPSWPFHDGIPSELRKHPPIGLTDLTIEHVVAHYETIIAGLDEEPLLIGHSMGGLVVQLLLARGHGRAGVAIDSAPPKGVSTLRWSFLKSTIGFLGKDEKPIVPTEKWFTYAMGNNLPEDQVAAAFDTLVPESRRVAKAPTKPSTRIDWEAERPPLLMVGGSDDHIIPAGLNVRNADQYGEAAPTLYQEFEGRTHWILFEPGWEEVAAASEAFLVTFAQP